MVKNRGKKMEKKNIKDYDLEELKQEVEKLGEKKFRGRQIFKWL